ncbi:hypothetical protein N0V84_006538 [Fusarium piperis]|uniref:Uncharacterized protein n=1 Tax=Fusarium piperis TaxID=1435070 RepID=A0A9W8WBV5_9HYPO|nr:hypothetical protein N0V84_006538 [Fusarium piperis]
MLWAIPVLHAISASILASGGAAFWWMAISQPSLPKGNTFMARACPLHFEIYNTTQSHMTLYRFLGVAFNATEEKLLKSYQSSAQKFGAEAQSCLTQLREADSKHSADQTPKACLSQAYKKADRHAQMVTDVTLFLLDKNERSQYDMYLLPLLDTMYEAEIKMDDKSDVGKWIKHARKMGKLQGSTDSVLREVCGKYAMGYDL